MSMLKINYGKTIAVVDCKYYPEKDCIAGTLYLYNARNPKDVIYKANLALCLADIRKQVRSMLNNRVGWSWKQLKRSASKIVKRVGSKQFLRDIHKIATDPRIAKVAALSGTIYPPLGISYAAVRGGAALLDGVTKGDPEAQAKLVNIAEQAREGNIEAVKLARALSAMYKAKQSGTDISGWAYNLPFRSAPPAGKSRSIYARGLLAAPAGR